MAPELKSAASCSQSRDHTDQTTSWNSLLALQLPPPSKQWNWFLRSGAVKSAGTAQEQSFSSKLRAPLLTRKKPCSPQYSPQEFRTIQYRPSLASVPQPTTEI